MKRVFWIVVLMVTALSVISFIAVGQERIDASIVTIEGDSYYVHSVKKGETIYSVSKLYSVSEQQLRSNNPMIVEGLQEGMVLKIPVLRAEEKLSKRQFRRTFDTHTVNKGETLYSISRRYEIPVATLLEDNEGLDPAAISIGQSLNVRKKSQGESSAAQAVEQMEEYRDAINQIASDVTYHLVDRGETLYGLSKKYSVTEQQIQEANNLAGGRLQAGAMIVIPTKSVGSIKADAKETGKEFTNDQNIEDERRYEWKEGDSRPTYPPYMDPDWDESQRWIDIDDLKDKEVINLALLLPIDVEGVAGDNFLDFYQGMLLGLEDLKAEGISTNVSLFNTSRSREEIERIVALPEFKESDLIVGPVYESGLRPVLEFAERKKIAVVSPLATIENESSSMLFQMAPSNDTKFDKLKALINEKDDINLIYVTSSHPDSELESLAKSILPSGYSSLTFSKNAIPGLDKALNHKGENIIIVSCLDESTVDRILATISSMHNNLTARSISNADIRVVGSSKWSRFRTSIDINLYFKLKLTYVTSYHADRANPKVREFDGRFVEAFSSLPTLYSYRGYDVAKLFVGGIKGTGVSYPSKLNRNSQTLLQMKYRFDVVSGEIKQDGRQKEEIEELVLDEGENIGSIKSIKSADIDTTTTSTSSRARNSLRPAPKRYRKGFENQEWALVMYNSNYSIEVR